MPKESDYEVPDEVMEVRRPWSGTEGDIPKSSDWSNDVDQILEIAREVLPEPRSLNVDVWQDQEYRIKVFHKGRGDHKETVYYHSDEDRVLWGLENSEELIWMRELKDGL